MPARCRHPVPPPLPKLRVAGSIPVVRFAQPGRNGPGSSQDVRAFLARASSADKSPSSSSRCARKSWTRLKAFAIAPRELAGSPSNSASRRSRRSSSAPRMSLQARPSSERFRSSASVTGRCGSSSTLRSRSFRTVSSSSQTSGIVASERSGLIVKPSLRLYADKLVRSRRLNISSARPLRAFASSRRDARGGPSHRPTRA
jgi:hypothetical protein